MKRQLPIIKRITALAVIFSFTVTNHFGASAFAASSFSPKIEKGTDSELLPAPFSLQDITQVKVPSEIGEIQEVYQVKGQETGDKRQENNLAPRSVSPSPLVILIQDAHAIPDAQKNIQRLIEHFKNEYGVDLVALEGAAAKLDTRLFKSFPDKKTLKTVFEEYCERGELAGGIAAAIFSAEGKNETLFRGIENWKLYEEGLALYLEASQKQVEILEKLQDAGRKLQAEKKKVYSKELLEVDKTLDAFYRNETDLVAVLKKLSHSTKGTGSEVLPVPFAVQVLLEEIEKEGKDSAGIEREVRTLAEQVRKLLLHASSHRQQTAGHGQPETRTRELAAFNQKYQEYQTSQITPQAFALYLKDLIEKGTGNTSLPVPFSVSKHLFRLMKNQKRIQDIQGTKLFDDFEDYAQEVKDLLIKNDEVRALDRQSQDLRLLERFARLELSHKDWQEIKTKDQGLKTEGLNWSTHVTFYETANKRDEAFFKNLLHLMNETNPPNSTRSTNSAIFVAGGFHTEGLTKRFKEKGISYIVVMPHMDSVPDESHYRAHMHGDVSWKDYFEAENGRVNLYKAFVRGTRDKLLGMSHESWVLREKEDQNTPSRLIPQDSRPLLKSWRDQIIRDLAAQNQIAHAHAYTQFLDEVSGTNLEDKWRSQWLANIDRFINSLGQLETKGQLNEPNVLKLLKPATTISAAAGTAIGTPDAWVAAPSVGRGKVKDWDGASATGYTPQAASDKPQETVAVSQPEAGSLQPDSRAGVRANDSNKLEQVQKFFEGQSGSANQSPKGSEFENSVIGNRKDGAYAFFFKNNVGAPLANAPTSFLKGFYDFWTRKIRWEFTHSGGQKKLSRDVEQPAFFVPPFFALGTVVQNLKTVMNSQFNIAPRFRKGFSLAYTAWKGWAFGNVSASFIWINHNSKLHPSNNIRPSLRSQDFSRSEAFDEKRSGRGTEPTERAEVRSQSPDSVLVSSDFKSAVDKLIRNKAVNELAAMLEKDLPDEKMSQDKVKERNQARAIYTLLTLDSLINLHDVISQGPAAFDLAYGTFGPVYQKVLGLLGKDFVESTYLAAYVPPHLMDMNKVPVEFRRLRDLRVQVLDILFRMDNQLSSYYQENYQMQFRWKNQQGQFKSEKDIFEYVQPILQRLQRWQKEGEARKGFGYNEMAVLRAISGLNTLISTRPTQDLGVAAGNQQMPSRTAPPQTESKSAVVNTALTPHQEWVMGGNPRAIVQQEKEGQKQLSRSQVLPIDGTNGQEAEWAALGVQLGAPVENDPLFRHVTFPEGWKIVPTEHDMWSDLVDADGKVKAKIFYKAAFYDRRANVSIETSRSEVRLPDERSGSEPGMRQSARAEVRASEEEKNTVNVYLNSEDIKKIDFGASIDSDRLTLLKLITTLNVSARELRNAAGEKLLGLIRQRPEALGLIRKIAEQASDLGKTRRAVFAVENLLAQSVSRRFSPDDFAAITVGSRKIPLWVVHLTDNPNLLAGEPDEGFVMAREEFQRAKNIPSPRLTYHFTLNSAMNWPWSVKKFVVIVPLQDLVRENPDNFLGGIEGDTMFWAPVKMPKTTRIFRSSENVKASKEALDFLHQEVGSDGIFKITGWHQWDAPEEIRNQYRDLLISKGLFYGHHGGHWTLDFEVLIELLLAEGFYTILADRRLLIREWLKTGGVPAQFEDQNFEPSWWKRHPVNTRGNSGVPALVDRQVRTILRLFAEDPEQTEDELLDHVIEVTKAKVPKEEWPYFDKAVALVREKWPKVMKRERNYSAELNNWQRYYLLNDELLYIPFLKRSFDGALEVEMMGYIKKISTLEYSEKPWHARSLGPTVRLEDFRDQNKITAEMWPLVIGRFQEEIAPLLSHLIDEAYQSPDRFLDPGHSELASFFKKLNPIDFEEKPSDELIKLIELFVRFVLFDPSGNRRSQTTVKNLQDYLRHFLRTDEAGKPVFHRRVLEQKSKSYVAAQPDWKKQMILDLIRRGDLEFDDLPIELRDLMNADRHAQAKDISKPRSEVRSEKELSPWQKHILDESVKKIRTAYQHFGGVEALSRPVPFTKESTKSYQDIADAFSDMWEEGIRMSDLFKEITDIDIHLAMLYTFLYPGKRHDIVRAYFKSFKEQPSEVKEHFLKDDRFLVVYQILSMVTLDMARQAKQERPDMNQIFYIDYNEEQLGAPGSQRLLRGDLGRSFQVQAQIFQGVFNMLQIYYGAKKPEKMAEIFEIFEMMGEDDIRTQKGFGQLWKMHMELKEKLDNEPRSEVRSDLQEIAALKAEIANHYAETGPEFEELLKTFLQTLYEQAHLFLSQEFLNTSASLIKERIFATAVGLKGRAILRMAQSVPLEQAADASAFLIFSSTAGFVYDYLYNQITDYRQKGLDVYKEFEQAFSSGELQKEILSVLPEGFHEVKIHGPLQVYPSVLAVIDAILDFEIQYQTALAKAPEPQNPVMMVTYLAHLMGQSQWHYRNYHFASELLLQKTAVNFDSPVSEYAFLFKPMLPKVQKVLDLFEQAMTQYEKEQMPRSVVRVIVADYGDVNNWAEAFKKARELFKNQEIDAVATVSLKEFKSGGYMAPIVRGAGALMGLPSDEAYLDMLAQVSPGVYPGNVNFHLVKEELQVSGSPTEKDTMPFLTIIYLKPGEQYSPRAEVRSQYQEMKEKVSRLIERQYPRSEVRGPIQRTFISSAERRPFMAGNSMRMTSLRDRTSVSSETSLSLTSSISSRSGRTTSDTVRNSPLSSSTNVATSRAVNLSSFISSFPSLDSDRFGGGTISQKIEPVNINISKYKYSEKTYKSPTPTQLRAITLAALALAPDAGRVVLAKIDSNSVKQIINRYRANKQELRSQLREQVDSVKYTAQLAVMNNLDAQMTELKEPSLAIAAVIPDELEGDQEAIGYFLEGYFDGIDRSVGEMLIDGRIPDAYQKKLSNEVTLRSDLNVTRPTVLKTSEQGSVPVAMFAEPAGNTKIHSMFTPVFINDIAGLISKLSKDPDAPQKLRWLGKLASRTEIHLADLSQVARLKKDPNALKAELLRRLDLEGYDLIAISQNGGRPELRINAIQAELAFSDLVHHTIESAA